MTVCVIVLLKFRTKDWEVVKGGWTCCGVWGLWIFYIFCAVKVCRQRHVAVIQTSSIECCKVGLVWSCQPVVLLGLVTWWHRTTLVVGFRYQCLGCEGYGTPYHIESGSKPKVEYWLTRKSLASVMSPEWEKNIKYLNTADCDIDCT